MTAARAPPETTKSRRNTFPPSLEGNGFAAGGRSSDSRLPPPPPSRPSGQWHFGGRASPLTAAGPCRLRTGFPHRSPCLECGTVPLATLAVQMATRTLTRWGPLLAWAGLIFALSSMPALGTGLGDVGSRAPEARPLRRVRDPRLRCFCARSPSVPAAVLAGAAYAVTDEVHQIFVSGRQGSPLDWLIDVAGVVAGVAIALRLARAQG